MSYKNIIPNIVWIGAFFYLCGGFELSNHIEVPSFKEETVRIERVQIQEQDQGVFLLNLESSGTAIGFIIPLNLN